MSRAKLWLLLAALVAPLHSGPPRQKPGTPSQGLLLQPSTYHGHEVRASSGAWWWTLSAPEHGRSILKRRRIRVTSVADPVGGPGEDPSGKQVSVPGLDAPPLFLFQGVPGLRAGVVPSRAEPVDLRPNQAVSLGTWRGEATVVEVVCQPPSDSSEDAQAPATLVLRRGSRRQELLKFQATFAKGTYVGAGREGNLRLLWVGDLNGDGCADVILDLADHYNLRLPTLFCSRGGRSGPLVRRAAQLRSTGC